MSGPPPPTLLAMLQGSRPTESLENCNYCIFSIIHVFNWERKELVIIWQFGIKIRSGLMK